MNGTVPKFASWMMLFTFLIVTTLASSASADEVQVGHQIRSAFGSSNARAIGGFAVTHSLSATTGQSIVLELDGPGVGSIVITGPNNFSVRTGAMEDPAAYITIPADGVYSITVDGYQRGRYSLRARSGDPENFVATSLAQSISIGPDINGDLQTTDARMPSGTYGDAYTFAGAAGQEIEVRMNAPTFNPMITIDGPGGFRAANNFDVIHGTPDKNARLTVTLPADGIYRVVAGTGAAEPQTGAYAIRVVNGADAARDRAAIIALAPQQLARGDALLEEGNYSRANLYYDHVLRLDPNNIYALVNSGVAYFRNNELEMAEMRFTAAVRQEPSNQVAINNLRRVQEGLQQARLDTQNRQAALEAEQRQRSAAEAQAWGRLLTGAAIAAAGGDTNQVSQALNGQTVTPRAQPQASSQASNQASQSGGARGFTRTMGQTANGCIERTGHNAGRSYFRNGCSYPVWLEVTFPNGNTTDDWMSGNQATSITYPDNVSFRTCTVAWYQPGGLHAPRQC